MRCQANSIGSNIIVSSSSHLLALTLMKMLMIIMIVLMIILIVLMITMIVLMIIMIVMMIIMAKSSSLQANLIPV